MSCASRQLTEELRARDAAALQLEQRVAEATQRERNPGVLKPQAIPGPGE